MAIYRTAHSHETRSSQQTCAARGFSLIEVLIAMLVLATGILSLTLLQVNVTRSAADAKTRSVGMAYAEQELERLRAQATNVSTYQALADSASAVIAGSAAATGTEFQMSRTVVRYVQSTSSTVCGSTANTPCFASNSSDAGGSTDLTVPEYKSVTVNITWTGADATPFSVTATDIFSKVSLAGSTSLIGGDTSASSAGPQVIQAISSTGMDAAGVIPIATGGDNGEATAASNPKPLVDNSTGTAATSFNVLTYLNPNTGNVKIQRTIETRMLSCKCEYGAPTESGVFFSTKMRPTFWNGTFYEAPATVAEDGLSSSTPTTRAATSEFYYSSVRVRGANVVEREINQSDLCNDCCRDHHDPSGVASDKPKFDPFLPTGVAHDHYGYALDGDGNSATTPTLITSTTPDDSLTGEPPVYVEACRAIRVDGIWRIATDMRLEHMGLLATNQDAGGTKWAPTTAASNRYVTFVKDMLAERRISGSGSSATSADNSLTSAEITALEGDPTPSLNPGTEGLAKATSTKKYLHDRGLYLDYLSPESKAVFDQVLKDCEEDAIIDCLLPFLPFVTINTTELASFSSTGLIQVTNQTLDNSDVAEPRRGVVQPVAGAEVTTNAIDATASPKMFRSNSGLVFALPIDPSDGSNLTTYPDAQLTDTQAYKFSDTGFLDSDSDGVADGSDNCPSTANADQLDTDGDGLGNACDTDDDGDGVLDGSDNCSLVANASQTNTDGQGLGDACSVNSDGDNFWDDVDNCDNDVNNDQADADGDGIGDVCDLGAADVDSDGIADASDNCPNLANADQLDSDGDGIGNVCDLTPFPVLPYTLRLTASGQAFGSNPSMHWDPNPANTAGQDCAVTSGSGVTPLTYTCSNTTAAAQTLKISNYSQIIKTTRTSDQWTNPCQYTTGSGSSRVVHGSSKINLVKCYLYTPGTLSVSPTRTGFPLAGTENSGTAFTGTGGEASISGSFPTNNRYVTFPLTGVTANDVYSLTLTSRVIDMNTTTYYTCDTSGAGATDGLPIYNFAACQ